jgi:WD40 repeat protein
MDFRHETDLEDFTLMKRKVIDNIQVIFSTGRAYLLDIYSYRYFLDKVKELQNSEKNDEIHYLGLKKGTIIVEYLSMQHIKTVISQLYKRGFFIDMEPKPYLKIEKKWRLYENKKSITSCSISPNGNYICTGTSTGEIKIWEYLTQKEVFSYHFQNMSIDKLIFSQDCQKLICISDSKIGIWDFPIDLSSMQWIESNSKIKESIFSPNNKEFLTISNEQDGTRINIWDEGQKNSQSMILENENIIGSSYNSNSTYVTVSSKGVIKTWDSTKLVLVQQIQISTPITSCVFSPNKNQLIIVQNDNIAKLYDLKQFELIKQFWTSVNISCCTFSFDGKWIIIGSESLIGVSSNKNRNENKESYPDAFYWGINDQVTALCYHPSRSEFVVCTDDGDIIYFVLKESQI